eukprot:m.484922 g.484922  ORF g.484922 m.484922 type:complete len:157 (-) comp57206_c0_seq3:1000-1470(-)
MSSIFRWCGGLPYTTPSTTATTTGTTMRSPTFSTATPAPCTRSNTSLVTSAPVMFESFAIGNSSFLVVSNASGFSVLKFNSTAFTWSPFQAIPTLGDPGAVKAWQYNGTAYLALVSRNGTQVFRFRCISLPLISLLRSPFFPNSMVKTLLFVLLRL